MQSTPGRRSLLQFASVFVLASAATAVCLGIPSHGLQQQPGKAQPNPIPSTGSIDFSRTLQRIDGFGFSGAFGQAGSLQALPNPQRTQILNLLFSRDTGAGLNILRLGIETDSTLEPAVPANPSAPPHYTFDNNDGGQLWLAQQAQRYGVTNFTADAWTAPAFMKTNHKDVGGALCGLVDAPCGGANWSSAFADYLLQYVRFYRSVGIHIASLGFANEPDIPVSYASMSFSPQQAIEFLNVFGPAVRHSGLDLRLTCCDASNWKAAERYTSTLESDPAREFVDIVTAHEYGSHADAPLPTTHPVWMTEWSSGITTFNPQWDCNGCFGSPDGISLAHDILQALTLGNVSAYLYWWGAGTGPASLIQIASPTSPDKPPYTVAKRFYALAAISRFLQPGASRVSAQSPETNLEVAAFRNPNGSKLLVLLNTATAETKARFVLQPDSTPISLQTYLTDATHSLTEAPLASLDTGTLNLALPPRSLTSVLLSPSAARKPHRPQTRQP